LTPYGAAKALIGMRKLDDFPKQPNRETKSSIREIFFAKQGINSGEQGRGENVHSKVGGDSQWLIAAASPGE